jgi:TatD DNase family protein
MKMWLEMGLEYVIGVSTKYNESLKILEVSKKYEQIIPGIGIHPWKAKSPLKEETKKSFSDILENNSLIVIGEIGLDHHFIKKTELYQFQEDYLKFFLSLAEKYSVPVNIHTKGAEEECSDILSSYKIHSSKILIHWYSGPKTILKIFRDRGYFFSVNPSILSGSTHIKVVEENDISQLLTESDGNFKYNINNERIVGSPKLVPQIIEKIASLKSETTDNVSAVLHANILRYLNIP